MQATRGLLAAAVLIAMTAPLLAQGARATGTVRDTMGRPIRGATIRATNPEARPSEFTSTTNNRGQWGMIGLRSGTWTFLAEAPGFAPIEATLPVRAAGSSPIAFTLERDPSTLPGALDRQITQQLEGALALVDAGRYDQALAAYTDIRTRNPKLTSVNLLIADVYRQKAAQEPDAAARKGLLERAVGAYSDLLAVEIAHERARVELEAVRAQIAAIP